MFEDGIGKLEKAFMDLEGLEDWVIGIDGRLSNLEKTVNSVPITGLYEKFTCSQCGSNHLVAVTKSPQSLKYKSKEDNCMLRALGIAHRYVFSRFWTHKPIFLTHSVTSECNCRCKICDIWRKKHSTDEMNTYKIFRMLDEARKLNFVAYIAFGGEPLMRLAPHFYACSCLLPTRLGEPGALLGLVVEGMDVFFSFLS